MTITKRVSPANIGLFGVLIATLIGLGACVSGPRPQSRDTAERGAAADLAQDGRSIAEELLSPPTSAGPFAYWWWPGTAVEPSLLRRDLDDLADSGFAGGYQFTSLFGVGWIWGDEEATAHANRFATPEYYEILADAVDAAERRGLRIDLLAGSGWPLGGTHVAPEDSSKTLAMGVRKIEGGSRFSGPVPDWDRDHFMKSDWFFGDAAYTAARPFELIGVTAARILEDRERDPIPALTALTEDPRQLFGATPPWTAPILLDPASVVDLFDRVSTSGRLEWDVPPGEWYVFAYYGGPIGEIPLFDARDGRPCASLVLDHLAREPIRSHLDHVIGRSEPYVGDHFGDTIRAVNSPSVELKSDWLWTDAFLEEFRERRGYDLTPFLMSTYVPGRDNFVANIRFGDAPPLFDFADDSVGERVRYDYENTVSDLFIDNYLGGFAEWAWERGLATHSQTFGMPVDTIRSARYVDMPDTESLYGGGTLDFLTLTASAAALHGRRIAGGEFLTWMSRDYMTSPHKIKVHADRFFVSGINQLHYHTMYYQAPEAPYPGFNAWSQPYMPVSFAASITRANPIFDFIPELNEYIARNQLIGQRGPNMANIGLFHNIWRYPGSALRQEETVNGYLGSGDVPPALGFPPPFEALSAEEQHIYRRVETGDALKSAGYDYVLVNTDSVMTGELVDGALHMGDIRMEALVLSRESHLPAPLAQRLVELVDEGFHVFFVGYAPERHSGFHDYRRNDEIVRAAGRRLAGERSLAPTAEILPTLMERAGIEPGLRFGTREANLQYIRRRVGDSVFYFIRSGSETPREVTVTLPGGETEHPWIVDLWTGVRTIAPEYRRTEEGVTIPVVLDAFGSMMVEMGPAAASHRHVVRGDAPVEREGGEFVFETAEGGTYRFTTDDGSVVAVDVPAPPAEIAVPAWSVEALSRSTDGELTPIALSLDTLADWRDIPELRYEGGRATYRAAVEIPEAYLTAGVRLVLDLGRVHETAAITINGRNVAELLMPPYRTDITRFVSPGTNYIEIEVTPVLYNRLVGYGEAGDPRWTQFQGRNGLAPTGLIGPVTIEPRRRGR
ncbi:MAG: hypothetical protein MI724_05305, partial [Spirochaetales bacterium]|nr:hypothetical protein [Spirochaetales bacterium]